MWAISFAEALLIGVAGGVALAAIFAGWLWVHLTPGDDHLLSDDEVRARVGTVWLQ